MGGMCCSEKLIHKGGNSALIVHSQGVLFAFLVASQVAYYLMDQRTNSFC
ncbi:hypothetical protein SAMN04488109_1752 [Chryseolinea serpens]|uniref:Uncharacterized protein n=1 Tax=Chryseolinea serpens TaxID=947013 RepID=A0A1M5MHQ5_9BACT|nr:hypothetical protein SAMN04488109_1752 [Chryseolinea serpens]